MGDCNVRFSRAAAIRLCAAAIRNCRSAAIRNKQPPVGHPVRPPERTDLRAVAPAPLVFGDMEAGLPWSEYSKARLARGFSHAVGRGQVEQALRLAGAEIDSLSFGPPWVEPGERFSMIFDFYWIGDGKSRTRGPTLDRDRLLMRWHAMPAALRSALAPQIVDRWLPEACSWAATALRRGNVWRATDHRWMLLRSEVELAVRTE